MNAKLKKPLLIAPVLIVIVGATVVLAGLAMRGGDNPEDLGSSAVVAKAPDATADAASDGDPSGTPNGESPDMQPGAPNPATAPNDRGAPTTEPIETSAGTDVTPTASATPGAPAVSEVAPEDVVDVFEGFDSTDVPDLREPASEADSGASTGSEGTVGGGPAVISGVGGSVSSDLDLSFMNAPVANTSAGNSSGHSSENTSGNAGEPTVPTPEPSEGTPLVDFSKPTEADIPVIPPADGATVLEQTFGPLHVRVGNIRLGKSAAIRSGSLQAGQANALIANVTVENTSPSATILYQSWNEMNTFDLPVALSDDVDSRYRQRLSGKSGLVAPPKAVGNVATINDGNRLAAMRNPKPLVLLVTFKKCEMNDAIKSMIQELAGDWQGSVNFGLYEVQAGSEPNSYMHTKFTQELEKTYGIKLPCVLVYNEAKPAAGWGGNPGPVVIEEELSKIATKTPPGAPLKPGEKFTEEIAFDPPAENAKHFTLELPTAAFGKSGQTLKFTFPKSSIKVDPWNQ